jgi:hypothetical protein
MLQLLQRLQDLATLENTATSVNFWQLFEERGVAKLLTFHIHLKTFHSRSYFLSIVINKQNY